MPAVNRQLGFTYLTVLFVVAFMGVGMALVGEMWHTVAVREREVELLQVGNQYRKAIERYYRSGPSQYPRSLADLVKDPRKPGVERYLRRIYPDPVTGKDEWGIMKAPDGGVMGVYSLSEGKPFKRTNFRQVDKDFENAAKYADWKFIYLPVGPQAPLQPGVKPAPGLPGTSAPGQTAPGAVAPPTFQAVPGSSMPGGTSSTAPGSFGPGSSGSSSFGSGSSAPSSSAPAQTQPFLSIQPTPSSPSPAPAQPSTSMQPEPGTSDER